MIGIKKIIIASDHGGVKLKRFLAGHLNEKYEVVDKGCHNDTPVDFPDYAEMCCHDVLKIPGSTGILICGSGIGMSIAANKIDGIRAALCCSEYHCRMARMHNDANVLCMGERFTAFSYAVLMTDIFLNTGFNGGRYALRADKIKEIETKNMS